MDVPRPVAAATNSGCKKSANFKVNNRQTRRLVFSPPRAQGRRRAWKMRLTKWHLASVRNGPIDCLVVLARGCWRGGIGCCLAAVGCVLHGLLVPFRMWILSVHHEANLQIICMCVSGCVRVSERCQHVNLLKGVPPPTLPALFVRLAVFLSNIRN